MGVLDREGNLGFKMKGSRDECVATIEATARRVMGQEHDTCRGASGL